MSHADIAGMSAMLSKLRGDGIDVVSTSMLPASRLRSP